MKFIKVSISILLIIGCTFLFYGCSEDDKGNNSSNSAPVINSLTSTPDSMGVDLGQSATLTVTASDPDGDAITITWEASDGEFNTTSGETVTWTAPTQSSTPAVLSPSSVTVTVSDGAADASDVYIFYYDEFADLVGSPTIDSVHVVPGLSRVVSPSTQVKRWLNLYARVPLDLTQENTIGWLSVEASNGNVYYLDDSGEEADPTANDNEYNAIKGGNTMVVDTMAMPFIAYNKYAKSDTMIFDLNFLLTETDLPTMIYPDSASGTGDIVADDILAYFAGQPEFLWEPYDGADYFELAVTDTSYHFELGQDPSLIYWGPIWLAGDAVSVIYNYDNSANPSVFQLDTYDISGVEYMLHLTVYVDGAWARREARLRRIN